MLRTTHRATKPSAATYLAATALSICMSSPAYAIPAAQSSSAAPWELAQGHQRPVLSAAEEDQWLSHLVAHSPHRLALQRAKTEHGDLPPVVAPTSATTAWVAATGSGKAWPRKPGPRNYGFLPYWTLKTTKLHWDKLTQLAWFSAEVSKTGVIGNTHGWGGATAKAVIAEAHKHGVQVTLTFTLFSKSGISNVIATAAKRKKLIDKIVSLVISGGGDGVNIDFEGLAKESRNQMKAFIADLTKEMHKKLPGSDVTLATPAVDWSGAWDYDYLAENSDGLFVMAYAIHYKGGNPGPQLPMASDKPWTHKTLQWIVDDYFKWGKAANKDKFIIGLPLYGNSWPSSSDKPGAKKLANGKAKTYENAQVEAPKKGGFKWDKLSQSTYYAYKVNGTWQQTWVDNLKAFKMRTAYLDKRGVHMGLWALGYADKNQDVWADIGEFIGPPASSSSSSSGGADAGGSSSSGADAGGSSSSSSGADAGGSSSSSSGADAGGSSSSSGGSDAGSATSSSSSSGADTGGSSSSGADASPSSSSSSSSSGGTDAGAATSSSSGGTDTAGTSSSSGGQDTTAAATDTGHDDRQQDASRSQLDANASDTGVPSVTNNLASKGDSGCQAAAPAGGPIPFAVMFVMTLMAIVSRRNPWQ